MNSKKLQNIISIMIMPALILATTVSPVYAKGFGLSPDNFDKMYALAASGNVRALYEAMYRGMDINATNVYGDTGLCVAAKRRDARAYNTFRMVGANPNHSCTWNIPYYDSFVNSDVVQAGAVWKSSDYTPPVYSMENSTSKYWIMAGGAAALGTVAVLLFSGGSGGSDDSSSEENTSGETGSDSDSGSETNSDETTSTEISDTTANSLATPYSGRQPLMIIPLSEPVPASRPGADFVPAFAYQNIERVRYINRTMTDLMQDNSSDKDERISIVSNNYYHDIKSHGGISGYEERLFGFSALYDRKATPHTRYGIGFGIYRADTDFDNGVNRDDYLFEVYNPYWFDYECWGALIMPYAGYSDGDYERYDDAKKHTADLKAYYYGLNNRIYLKKQASGINIEPTAEINLSGMYQDDFAEDGGISVKAKNMFSAEAGLGAYVSKAADFGEKGRLNLKFGGMYYYELNDDAYQSLNARFAGMSGMYYLDGYDNRRSRGIVSLKADYELKGWNLYAEVMRLLEHDDNMVYNAGLKYSF